MEKSNIRNSYFNHPIHPNTGEMEKRIKNQFKDFESVSVNIFPGPDGPAADFEKGRCPIARLIQNEKGTFNIYRMRIIGLWERIAMGVSIDEALECISNELMNYHNK